MQRPRAGAALGRGARSGDAAASSAGAGAARRAARARQRGALDGRRRDGAGARPPGVRVVAGRVEDAVPALELRAVDGEVGLVDELVRVAPVAREARDADRDRRADRLARGLDVEEPLGGRAADALGDLERLLGRRLREEDRELLAAEPRGDVVVAQVEPEDLRDARRTASPARWPYVLLMSRSRSRSAMISDSGRSKRAARASSSWSDAAKWRTL